MTLDETRDYLDTLPDSLAFFWFIENVTQGHPHRTSLFFYCRERARAHQSPRHEPPLKVEPMKLYKTTVEHTGENDDNDKTSSWQGSQAEASAVRAKAVSNGAKRKDVSTEQVDVPTDKEGLLAWLNANA